MRDKQFDHIIKNKLSGFVSQITPDWELFKAKKALADADGIANTFDTTIKATLVNYKTTSEPQWSAFQEFKNKLEQPSEPLFDSEVKAKLEGLESPKTPQWAAFQDFKSKAPSEAEVSFDASVKSQLEGYESDAQPQWAAFTDFRINKEINSSDDNFDARIQDELEGYESDAQPQWAAFTDFRDNRDISTSDDDFDARIKEELEGHKSDAEPQWAAFTDFRDNRDISNSDDDFDATIKDKIEGYETTAEPNWPAFLDARFDSRVESTLETYTPTGSPDWQAYLDRKFDSVIDAKVGEYESNSTPQWDKFLQKKREDEGVIADASFDKNVFGRLGQQKVRYNSEHWLMLKDRLQKIAYFRKQIFSYKTLEMVFVSLLLFTIGNHFFMFQGDKVITEAPMLVETEKNLETATTDNTDQLTEEIKAVGEEIIVETAMTTDSDLSTEVSSSSNSGDNSTIKTSQRQTNSGSSRNSLSGTQESLGGVTSDIPTTNEAITNVTKADRTGAATIADETTIGAATKEIDRALIANLDQIIFSDDLALLDHNRAMPETADAKYINLNKKKSYKNKGLWVHVVNSMDNNYITTPDNFDIGLIEKTHEKFAYHGEILISKAFQRWELETGLGYSFLDYEPYDSGSFTYDAQNKVREVDFKKINLDFIHLPVNAKYHFIQNGRWSLFAGAGISNDFILRTTYEIDDKILGGQPGSTMDPEPDELPDFYNREFTEGIFGNAPELPTFVDYKTKSNNYLLRGTLSLGAERNISDNFAAYIRTTYFHTLYNTEIGPYNDKLNKVNFGMGFKLRFSN